MQIFDMQTQFTIVDAYMKIKDDVAKLFNYMNGKVNPHNPCILNLAYFSPCNYAQYQAPNLISIFLGSIIQMSLELDKADKTNSLRDYIMSITAVTTAHELTHSEQCIDPIKYSKDAAYATMIENSAEYNAEIFCVSHRFEFKEQFGFEFVTVSRTDPIAYPEWNYQHHVINSMLGVFRCQPIINHVMKLLEGKNNVAIAIRYATDPPNTPGDVIPIRAGGHFIDDIDTITWYNEKLMQYRNLICAYKYKFSIYDAVYMNRYNGREVEYDTVVIVIDQMSYEPFLFN